ncbi:hypothetical protein [Thermococcus stetteri]|uniref:hypothetical protein n=1 Tax=Thermococcus stetteri TaxID=49900 RepID=UPI001AE9650D|nr:hypothetical protein [Thermococcus stetteri]MBP1911034.1 hypothetical protein [Thermococcus stetteri]
MRTLGYIFIFLGLLILLKEFQPALLEPLKAYAPYIKNSFWGVTLMAIGLYMITKRWVRRTVLALYVIYLILYLVV